MESSKRNIRLDPVTPAKPLAPWFGGKRNLAKRLIDRIEAIPHGCYVEPFGGMGGVFLRRGGRPPVEVLNDLSRDIANLFRVVQHHHEPLVASLRWLLTSREEFRRQLSQPPEVLTDIQRAARFLYLQRHRFAGVPTSSGMSINPYHGARGPLSLLDLIARAHTRLSRAIIEQLPFDECIRRYDRKDTLFYLDPPYWGHEATYGQGLFSREDFERLAQQLHGIKGRFLLSIGDHPEIRRVFAKAKIEEVEVGYSARGRRQVTELIISGPRGRR